MYNIVLSENERQIGSFCNITQNAGRNTVLHFCRALGPPGSHRVWPSNPGCWRLTEWAVAGRRRRGALHWWSWRSSCVVCWRWDSRRHEWSWHNSTDRVKPSFVISDIRALWRSGHSDAQPWASECPGVKNYKWRFKLVWHRMLHSCTHMATAGFKGLTRKLSNSHCGMHGCISGHG